MTVVAKSRGVSTQDFSKLLRNFEDYLLVKQFKVKVSHEHCYSAVLQFLSVSKHNILNCLVTIFSTLS